MLDTTEGKIDYLIEQLKQAEPLVQELQLRIIERGCSAAGETLLTLLRAVLELHESVTQEDFLNLPRYVAFAKEDGSLCTCERCKELEARMHPQTA